MTLWLHFGCEQIVFKPDGSQFNLRKMHCSLLPFSGGRRAQRARFVKKVHKPPLGVNFINIELNKFIGSIWVSWNPSDPKKS